MQGVPELEGMQQTEAPLDEIEVKTVIELFGVKVRTLREVKRTILQNSSNSPFSRLYLVILAIVSAEKLADPTFDVIRLLVQ